LTILPAFPTWNWICSLKELEMLSLLMRGEESSERLDRRVLLEELQRLSKLKFLKLPLAEGDLGEVRQALPNCVVVGLERSGG
jgi:hypothetical protein